MYFYRGTAYTLIDQTQVDRRYLRLLFRGGGLLTLWDLLPAICCSSGFCIGSFRHEELNYAWRRLQSNNPTKQKREDSLLNVSQSESFDPSRGVGPLWA